MRIDGTVQMKGINGEHEERRKEGREKQTGTQTEGNCTVERERQSPLL